MGEGEDEEGKGGESGGIFSAGWEGGVVEWRGVWEG